MRIALISITGPAAPDVRLAGHPIAWHQLQSALALSCERVICLAEAPGPALAAVQREAERRGATFHAIANHRALSGLVSAADTLLVLAPGVLPDREWLAQAFGARAGIATLPADGAVEQGFERIDRERAWAGVLATRGDAVEVLANLPPDADPVSGLLRAALQRGGSGIAVPDQWLDDGRWALVTSPAAAQRYQNDWYARHVPAPSVARPGAWFGYAAARKLIDRAANPERAAFTISAGGVALTVAGAIAGYLGWITAGLSVLTIGSVLLSAAGSLARLSGAGVADGERRWTRHASGAMIDLALVAIAASAVAFEGWWTGFAALVLIAAIRLSGEEGAPRLLRPLSDRGLVLAGLVVLAAAGVLGSGMACIALLALAVRLFAPPQWS